MSNFFVKWATFGQLLKIFGATFERYPSNLCKSLLISEDIDNVISRSFTSVCPNSPWKMASDRFVYIIKKNYTVAWRYEFYFLVLKTIFYERAQYCVYHSKIKFISSRRRVISSIYCTSVHVLLSSLSSVIVPNPSLTDLIFFCFFLFFFFFFYSSVFILLEPDARGAFYKRPLFTLVSMFYYSSSCMRPWVCVHRGGVGSSLIQQSGSPIRMVRCLIEIT